MVDDSKINGFCRNREMIYVETGQQKGQVVLRFQDFEGRRYAYTPDEVLRGLRSREPRSS